MNPISKLFKSLTPAPKPVSPFTPAALQEVREVLLTVGLTEGYGFSHHSQSHASYHGGVFEWSERENGTRFLLYARPGQPVHRVTVNNLNSEVVPEARLTEINATLALIISKFNN